MPVLVKASSNIPDESVGKLVGLLRSDRYNKVTVGMDCQTVRCHSLADTLTAARTSRLLGETKFRLSAISQKPRSLCRRTVFGPQVLGAAGDSG